MARQETVDSDLLGAFRLSFGLVNAVGALKALREKPVNFDFHFTYQGWPVPMLSPAGYDLLVVVSLISSLGIASGRATRFWAWIYFFSFGYWFLLEKSNYNNHYYLILIFAFFWATLGDAGFFALKKPPGREIPRWHLQLFRAQLILVYFYGGLAKLHRDWFLGNPMSHWLKDHSQWLSQQALWFSWGGLFFDLLIGPALLYRRTRPWAMLLALGFHLCNSQLFKIGVFPYLMIASLILFLDPGSLRKISFGGWRRTPDEAGDTRNPHWAWWVFAAWQVLMPLRHHLYPGNVDWNGEGVSFAWRMKLIDHRGKIDFVVEMPGGSQFLVNPRDQLSERQVQAMLAHPEMIVDFARHLRQKHQRPGLPAPSVRVHAWVRINLRKPQCLIDPEADLGNLQVPAWGHNPHVLPSNSRVSENPRLAAVLRMLLIPYLALGLLGLPGSGLWRSSQVVICLCLGLSTLHSSPLILWPALGASLLAFTVSLRMQRVGWALFALYQGIWIWMIWLAQTPEAG